MVSVRDREHRAAAIGAPLRRCAVECALYGDRTFAIAPVAGAGCTPVAAANSAMGTVFIFTPATRCRYGQHARTLAFMRRARTLQERSGDYCTVTETGCDGIPFATTSSWLAPFSMPEGTSKFVETVVFPVATPIVLWSCVRA